jgi:hypothetical protein
MGSGRNAHFSVVPWLILPKRLASGEDMFAELKIKRIDVRTSPGVEPAA